MLVSPDSLARVREFESSFTRAWAQDGWAQSDIEYLLNLPGRDTSGRHRREWAVKARSMDALFSVLDPGSARRVLDLGCGIGWLAHHMALRGHEIYAVDIVRDDRLGLGAAGRYVERGPSFERIWGELERPPFLDSSVDAVVCNASLHYAPDLSGALREIGRILRPGGMFILLNSPVHHDRSSALRAQEDFRRKLRRLGAGEATAAVSQHFSRASLEESIRTTIGPVVETPFDPGTLFRFVRQAKGFALRMELASFPVLSARKT
jgi:ubiquinone/menaquinone biosynthesis C-methylase UbiE